MTGPTEKTSDETSCRTDFRTCPNEESGAVFTDASKPLIFIRYLDHVLFHRAVALSVQPQIRETMGWLIYEAEKYITISWDRDADPPTLHGGDPKASGLVILTSDIIQWEKFYPEPLPKKDEMNLKSREVIKGPEYAFRPMERKTHRKGEH
jgi:hypothetical protein